MSSALTVFRGRCADRNPRGMQGAVVLGEALAQRLGLKPAYVGEAQIPLAAAWRIELEAARPALRNLSAHLDRLMSEQARPLTTLGRCAASLATLPVVARHRPDAMIVWFDAHADANTPQTSESGYLGGMVLTGASGAWDTGFGGDVNFDTVLLVGARDIDPYERDLIDAGRLRLIAPDARLGARLREAIAGRPVYIHIDCDVLDPAIVPTEYAVAGGLALEDLREAAAILAGAEVVGLEIAEFEAAWPDGRRASPAALIDALEPLLETLASDG